MGSGLLVVSGPPGAGKTTLAHALAGALGRPAVCRDEIKEAMVASAAGAAASDSAGAGAEPGDDLNRRTNAVFFETIAAQLRAGASLVAEAAFQDRLWRPGLAPFTELADIRVVRCVVDPEVARQRIADRAAAQPSRSAHDDAGFLRRIERGERPIESWVPIALDVPTLVVDTTRGWEPPLARIVEFAT